MRPKFVVKRLSDGWFWCGSNHWSGNDCFARSFDTETAAELAALRDLPDVDGAWAVQRVLRAA